MADHDSPIDECIARSRQARAAAKVACQRSLKIQHAARMESGPAIARHRRWKDPLARQLCQAGSVFGASRLSR